MNKIELLNWINERIESIENEMKHAVDESAYIQFVNIRDELLITRSKIMELKES